MTSNPPTNVVGFDKGGKSAFDFDLGRPTPIDLVQEREVPKEESAPVPAPSSTPATPSTLTTDSTDSIPSQTPGPFVPEIQPETKTTPTSSEQKSNDAPPAPPVAPATVTKAPTPPAPSQTKRP